MSAHSTGRPRTASLRARRRLPRGGGVKRGAYSYTVRCVRTRAACMRAWRGRCAGVWAARGVNISWKVGAGTEQDNPCAPSRIIYYFQNMSPAARRPSRLPACRSRERLRCPHPVDAP